jgi:hypothetical protein
MCTVIKTTTWSSSSSVTRHHGHHEQKIRTELRSINGRNRTTTTTRTRRRSKNGVKIIILSSSSSSASASASSSITTTTTTTTTTGVETVGDYYYENYRPSPVDQDLLNGQLIVIGVCSITVLYWWLVVVPNARINLAVNKKTGKLKTYLDTLKRDDTRTLERWFFTEWLMKVDPETKYLMRDSGGASVDDLSDTEGGGDKTNADDIDIIISRARKTPDFFSLDNPVLVTFLITIGFSAFIGVLGELTN